MLIIAYMLFIGLQAHAVHTLQNIALDTTDVAHAQPLARLEHARLTCQFDGKPLIQHVRTGRKDNGWEYKIYLLMHAHCDIQQQPILDALAQQRHEHFYIAMERVEQPIVALKVEIGYDPRYVQVAYDMIDTITHAKAVQFKLINRATIQELRDQERPLLQLAHCSMSRYVIL